MARDCPDRQRGANWRNDDQGGPGARPAAKIGGGDAVDREYESLMQELSGGAPVGNGAPPPRIEAGPGGYDNGDGYRGGESVKPWERGPTGGPAPWQQRGRDDPDGTTSARPWASGGGRGGEPYGGRGGDSYGGYNPHQGHYDAGPSAGGAAPWQQAAAPPGQNYGNYGGYPGGYDQNAYGHGQGMSAPPGLQAPPGLGPLFQNYGNAGSPPPPPPPGDAPPPPVSNRVVLVHNHTY